MYGNQPATLSKTKRLRSYCRPILALCISILLAGCTEPKNKVVWSPDGHKAGVLASDGLHILDDANKLSPSLMKDVQLVTWLQDSQHVLAVVSESMTSWKQIEPLISEQERGEIAHMAERLEALADSAQGDVEKLDNKLTNTEIDVLKSILLYSQEHGMTKFFKLWQDATEKERQKEKKKSGNEDKLAATIYIVRKFDLSGNQATPGPILLRTLLEPVELRAAPGGKMVAIVQRSSWFKNDGPFRLSVSSVDNPRLKTIAPVTSKYPDWTSDGQSIVFFSPGNPKSDLLFDHAPQDFVGWLGETISTGTCMGVLNRQHVVNEAGELKAEMPEAQMIAYLTFATKARVRCTSKGTIYFSAPSLSLPCTTTDELKSLQLYCWDQSRHAVVIPVIAKGSPLQRYSFEYFEISPDGTKVSVPTSNGEVAVLDVGSGSIDYPQATSLNTLSFIPQWKSSTELCLSSDADSKDKRAHVVLWTMAGEKVAPIDLTWPRDVISSVIDQKSP